MLNSSSWNHSQSFHCSLFSDDSQIYSFSSELCNELQTQFSTVCSTVPLACLAHTYYLSDQQTLRCLCFLVFLNSSQSYPRFPSPLFLTFDQLLCYVNLTLEISLKSDSSTSFPTHYHLPEFFLPGLLQTVPTTIPASYAPISNLSYTLLPDFFLKKKKSHNIASLIKDVHCLLLARRIKFRLVHTVYKVFHNLDLTYLSNLITCHSPQPHTLHNHQTELSCSLNTWCVFLILFVCISFSLGLESCLQFFPGSSQSSSKRAQ